MEDFDSLRFFVMSSGYKHLKFPDGTKFLVTGGAGFIGSNLCEATLNLGYNVRCLDALSTGKQSNVDMFVDKEHYEFIKGDIKNFDTCMMACKGIDYVLHEAAWGLCRVLLKCRCFIVPITYKAH